MMTDAANASQQHQQQPPPVMAHYKFHNDCQSSVLTYDQVKRLDQVIDQVVPIHGRGNFPTLYVRLKELVRLVKAKLQNEHSIEIRDIRLNGGAANYVLAPENSHYNDLDLVFGTDLSDESRFDVIRDVVLECLMEFYPSNKTTNSTTAIQASTAAAAAAADGLNQQVDRNTSETRNGNPSDSNKRDSYATSTSTTATTTNNTTTTIEAKQHDQVPERTCAGFGKDQVNGDPQASTKSARTPQVHHLDRSDTSDHQLPNSNENQQHHQHQNLIDALDCSSLKLSPSTAPPAFNNNQHVGPYYQMPLNNCAFKEAYVHKMVKVTDDDRWSLISLGVQQSEAGCCHQQPVFSRACNHCCPTTAASIDSQKVVLCSACPPICANSQYIDANLRPSPNFDGPTMCPNCPAHDDAKCHLYSGALTAVQPCEAAPLSQTHHQYHHHQQQHCLDSYCYGQPKQLPNSIELKFVDRMRRKFEFSVDSFQIILDSLIQFYDYAPQSTITIQRQPNNACCQMISKMNANFRVSLDNNRCTGCYCHDLDSNYKSNDDEVSYLSEHNREAHSDDIQESKAAKNNNNNKNLSGTKDKRKRQRSTVVNCAHGYYQLESRCSHSDGSVASSSGCSSSSSVASSSSSSLSYDDDNEDLYGDADSPASSSASTSSLISSTASSIYSNERRCDTTTIHDRCGNCNLRYQEAEHGQEVYNNAHQNLGLPMTFESSATQMSEFVECCLECEQQKQQYGRNYCQFNLSNCGKSDSETRRSSCAVISENFYPTVIGRSEYGNFKEALYHLERKLIATKSPEEIRGGGLLKYCNLLVKNYKATNIYQIRTLERYMCSRFFIDFSDLNQQRAKLESYLANHFSDDPMQKFNYLKILHTVVRRSTVCLMNHELRLILGMILELACKLEEQQKSQHASAVAAIQSQHQLSTPPPATTPTPSPAPPVSSSASLYSHQPKQQRSQQASQYAPAAAPLRCDKQQQQPIYYQQQKPISFEAGPYKVKLVNYAISKQPVRSKV